MILVLAEHDNASVKPATHHAVAAAAELSGEIHVLVAGHDAAGAAKTLREGTAAVLAKIEAKDAAGAQEAFKGATASCAACHKAHKK